MKVEISRVSSAQVVYMREYYTISRMLFPHHGGTILSGERDFQYILEQRVRDFVCPDCDRAYAEFWKIPGGEKFDLAFWKNRSNQPPLQTPTSGTPAAGAPVAPPSGAAGR